ILSRGVDQDTVTPLTNWFVRTWAAVRGAPPSTTSSKATSAIPCVASHPDSVTGSAVTSVKSRIVELFGMAKNDDVKAVNHDALGVFALYVDECGNENLQRVCRDTMDGLAFRLRLPNLD
ncbi:hypothetical protein IAE22_32555, partial [Bacillus sp. S34]|nr:hypothetical protein [Bacillus sp. S34]